MALGAQTSHKIRPSGKSMGLVFSYFERLSQQRRPQEQQPGSCSSQGTQYSSPLSCTLKCPHSTRAQALHLGANLPPKQSSQYTCPSSSKNFLPIISFLHSAHLKHRGHIPSFGSWSRVAARSLLLRECRTRSHCFCVSSAMTRADFCPNVAYSPRMSTLHCTQRGRAPLASTSPPSAMGLRRRTQVLEGSRGTPGGYTVLTRHGRFTLEHCNSSKRSSCLEFPTNFVRSIGRVTFWRHHGGGGSVKGPTLAARRAPRMQMNEEHVHEAHMLKVCTSAAACWLFLRVKVTTCVPTPPRW